MFTGIIEGLGTVKSFLPAGQGRRLTVGADFVLDSTKIGDSIAVNGACLTIVAINGKRFEADLSPETISKTTFGNAKTGDRVNLERALRFSDRLDGHLVSGHIDGLGTIKDRTVFENWIVITFEVPENLSRYMIEKGSVAVDGISLTINSCDQNSFKVSIIPHTAKLTTLGFKRVGGLVNIETDMIGKYVERFTTGRASIDRENTPGSSSIDKEFLEKSGFL
ncbi:riboflavin synthase [Thermodesulfobacteriota bacterium]